MCIRDRFNSIAVNAMPAEGYSTGDAIHAVQETAVQALPKGFGDVYKRQAFGCVAGYVLYDCGKVTGSDE